MGKLEETLNNLYKNDSTTYQEKLSFIKSMGLKVFRNSEGNHIIKYNQDDVLNSFEQLEEYRKRRNLDAFMKGLLS